MRREDRRAMVANEIGAAYLDMSGALREYKENASAITNGYVRNSKLHRRWIVAQYWRYRRNGGYLYHVDRLSVKESLKLMLEEMWVLSKIERADHDEFVERSSFFNKDVVVAACNKAIDRCNASDEAKYRKHIYRIEAAQNYHAVYRNLKAFLETFPDWLMCNTNIADEFRKAYINAGCYYNLKDMVMDKECFFNHNNATYRYVDGVNKLSELARGGYDDFYDLLEATIDANHYDFYEEMRGGAR